MNEEACHEFIQGMIGVVIPVNVLLNRNLSIEAKILYGYLQIRDNEELEVIVEKFSEDLNVSPNKTRKAIKELLLIGLLQLRGKE